jgi:hypothetical protein
MTFWPSRSIIFSASFMPFVLLCDLAHGATVDAPRCELVGAFLQQIVAGRDENMRGDLAEDLAIYMRDNPNCGESRSNLDALTRLLTDRNDAVVAGAAEALASMGPSAQSAVPALQHTLKEVDARLRLGRETMLPSQSSDQAIRDALRKITGKSIPDL